MKSAYTLLFFLALVAFSNCKDKPKQIQYTETIEQHFNKMEQLIKDNGNNINDNNIPQLKDEWALATDNMAAYEAEDKVHPCNEPECITAFRKGKEHMDALKQIILHANKKPGLDLNQLFPFHKD